MHIGGEKVPRMRNSGLWVADRDLAMKASCSIHSHIGGTLCGLFA